jgi:hypothetical protein
MKIDPTTMTPEQLARHADLLEKAAQNNYTVATLANLRHTIRQLQAAYNKLLHRKRSMQRAIDTLRKIGIGRNGYSVSLVFNSEQDAKLFVEWASNVHGRGGATRPEENKT